MRRKRKRRRKERRFPDGGRSRKTQTVPTQHLRPDSRTMSTRNGFVQGYNVQIVVDCSSQVIVACDVMQDGNESISFAECSPWRGRASAACLRSCWPMPATSPRRRSTVSKGPSYSLRIKSRKKAGLDELLPIIELGGRRPPSRRWSCCSVRTKVRSYTVCAARRSSLP